MDCENVDKIGNCRFEMTKKYQDTLTSDVVISWY